MPSKKPPPRALRADAARNQAEILRATEALLGTEGPSLSTEAVARRAGVGIGSVFRHFPTKELLLRAVVAARVERLTRDARALDVDDGEGLFRFFGKVVDHTTSSSAVHHALSALGVDPERAVASARRKFVASLANLLRRAQARHVVRNDVDVADVYALLVAVVHVTERRGRNTRGARRALLVVLDGLRPPHRPPRAMRAARDS